MAGEMLWTTQSGFLTNDKLNKMAQRVAQPMFRFRQFVRFKEAFGKAQGENVNWLKISNISDYGRNVAETETMPETKEVVALGTLSVTEIGNSIPFTGKLENLSEFDVARIIREGLIDDHVKVMDGNVEREFNNCLLRYVGTAAGGGVVTTNGTATKVNTAAMDTTHIRKMVTQLRKRNVPGWTSLGGDYVCIASVEASENVSINLQAVAQYTESGYTKIVNGEVGRFHGVRFVEDTFATRNTYTPATGAVAAKSWGGGFSLDAYMFGSPTVREAVAVPMEIRAKVVTDYGRSKGLAWYFLGGWKIEWDTSGAADTRIIKWDSAS